MNDEALRQECEQLAKALTNSWNMTPVAEYVMPYLLRFAKQQQAAGVRMAQNDLGARLRKEVGDTDDDAWEHIEWCEAQAKELER